MTPTEQAARWLDGIARFETGWRGVTPDENGDLISKADALAAIARHLAPGDELVERATAALEGVTEGEWKSHHYEDYSMLVVHQPQFTQVGHMYEAGDATFVEFARQWVPEAAARISALTATVGEWDALDAAWCERVAAITAENATLRDRLARIASAWPLVRDTDCSGGELASAIDEIDAAITDGDRHE